MTIFTIGHSTRRADEFLSLLRAHGVTILVDIRTVPKSRRHPHFAKDALAAFLGSYEIRYVHLPALGGLRKPRHDSPNGAWQNASFRGYADHMQTTEFAQGIDELFALAGEGTVAVMCAEAKWWQCHRQLVADALTARGIEVRHIMTRSDAPRHELTSFARVSGSRVTYPR
jgi:uncharacterized protein (DUF488 family)